ncbi:MAG: TIGR04283 family arsenosugar biosynthesis glycosyltransferase [Ferruginibacter sp.]
MTISIIIPTFNEALNIGKLVNYLAVNGGDFVKEIIVVDGGSSDQTKQLATSAGATVLTSPGKCRAIQMNMGASVASGSILFFVHADTIPPESFTNDITAAIKDGFDFGRYRSEFDCKDWRLKLNAFFTRFDLFVCYGGDQTLFVSNNFFKQMNGFDDALMIMEEYDFTKRSKLAGRYKIMPKTTLISTRKYDENGWLKVQRANYTIVKMYKNGSSQAAIVERYKSLIKQR